MKNLLFLFIILFIIFSTNTSCKKKEKGECWPPDTVYQGFSITEINKINYTGFDTLKFKNEATGIVYTFIGQGIDTSLTYYQRWFPDMCPEEFQKCKSQKFKYISPTFTHPLYLQAHNPAGDQDVAYLTIRFEGVDYFKDLGSIGKAVYTDTINGQIYNNLNNIDKYFSTSKDHIKYSLYEGILQIVSGTKIYSKQK
jgi:hypothetical protein